MITLSVNATPDIDAMAETVELGRVEVTRAGLRAINKTARSLRSLSAREVAKNLNVKVSLIRQGLIYVPARRSNLTSVVGLDQTAGVVFASWLGNAKKNSRGVRIGRRQFDHAFEAEMGSGHKGVFRRERKSRLPIQEVFLVVTGKLAKQLEEIENGMGVTELQKNFDREIRYIRKSK